MRKLRLDQDALRVESFVTRPDEGSRGTVVGRDSHPYSLNWDCQSYEATCYNQGCGTGLTSICATGQATDCPGQSECAPYTDGHTCANSCTEVEACTYCGAVC